MSIPGFYAEQSLARATRLYRGATGSAAGRGTFTTQAQQRAATFRTLSAAMVGRAGGLEGGGLRSVGAAASLWGGLGFDCSVNSCRCHGVDDCVDLLAGTNLCGTYITCTFEGVPECFCHRA